LVNPDTLRRILAKDARRKRVLESLWHPLTFPKFHQQHPYIFHAGGQEYRVDYLPAESKHCMFGGNSNWRGPVWMPVKRAHYPALLSFYLYYGEQLSKSNAPRDPQTHEPFEVSRKSRTGSPGFSCATRIGRRPSTVARKSSRRIPYWRDNIYFYEFSMADNGAGLGASHQTGWTGLWPNSSSSLASSRTRVLGAGRQAAFTKVAEVHTAKAIAGAPDAEAFVDS